MTSGQCLRRSFETDVIGPVEYLIKWLGRLISSRGVGWGRAVRGREHARVEVQHFNGVYGANR